MINIIPQPDYIFGQIRDSVKTDLIELPPDALHSPIFHVLAVGKNAEERGLFVGDNLYVMPMNGVGVEKKHFTAIYHYSAVIGKLSNDTSEPKDVPSTQRSTIIKN